MAKCVACVGCLKIVFVDNERYFVCPLCKIVYKSDGKTLTIVVDRGIITKVAEQKGWTIE